MRSWNVKQLLILLFVATVCLNPIAASAATKAETIATKQYRALKPGMTVEQVAKVLYGKTYKKQLKMKNGSQVLRLNTEIEMEEWDRNVLLYDLVNRKVEFPSAIGVLMFMTETGGTKYRLTMKQMEFKRDTAAGFRTSDRKLVKGAKIKNGLTEQQVDRLLTGKGLGAFGTLGQADTTSVLRKTEVKAGKATIIHTKSYVFPTATNQWQYVFFIYDAKKKTYRVESHDRY
ncbi:hypothetical protein RCC94_10285 [Exiguobacterium acetylicum]|uniref:hypothetical protein n=1 Tax=Exiguobacterium acetylicum TaxID=41170 RepID=UPI0027E0DB52|nr:hypothetical protein [Exiguobacterium acetylicum]MDQ6467877.1 hypothetical protein [Exiguobacterium acetylicum]